MQEIDKIKKAKSLIFLWRQVYNNLCRKCQIKLFERISKNSKHLNKMGTEKMMDRINFSIDDFFCPRCQKITKKIIGKE